MKKTLKIVWQVLLALLVLFIIIFAFRAWQIKTGRIMKLENGNWISRADYIKAYPPEGTIFPDKNTPFETYDQFYALIQKGDYENAVLLIDDGDKSRQPWYLTNLKKGGKSVDKWKNELPLKLNVENLQITGNHAKFNWDKKDGYFHSIDFTKKQDGYWKISDI